MKKEHKDSAAKRRDFLKLAGASTLGGAAAATVGATPAEATVESDRAAGYRETPHVKKAYELARF